MNRIGALAAVVAAIGLCMLPGCKNYYSVEVTGDSADQVRSVFLIVADPNPLDEAPDDPASLIDPEKIPDYLLFAQYDPEGEMNPMRWREESNEPKTVLIKLDLDRNGRTVQLRIDKELIEGYPGLTFVAVGHGADGWYAEVVEPGQIRFEKGMQLNALSARFVSRPLK